MSFRWIRSPILSGRLQAPSWRSTRTIWSPLISPTGRRILSIGTKHFVAFYLLSHGAVKLWVIIGLMRERLWYYPVALVIFTLFIVYQIHRYTLTHSVSLLLITVIDLVVICAYLARVLVSARPAAPDCLTTRPRGNATRAGGVNRRRATLFSG